MSAIDDKYAQLGGPGGWVGPPADEGAGSGEMGLPDGGSVRDFRNASIYFHPRTNSGAHEVHGAIRIKWAQLGGVRSFLGYPLTDETGTPDGVGRFNHFEGGSVYWTPQTNAHEVHGDIRQRWAEMGWERSRLRYPTTDEKNSNVPGGRFSQFQGGSIFWTPDRRIDVRFNID